MAKRLWNNQKPSSKGVDGNEMMMGIDLLQNCDLPPPSKVFAGVEKVLSSMNRMFQEDEFNEGLNESRNEKLELLKALRLSQTRAREAENKAAVLAKERDCLSNALVGESLRLLGYRQWVKLLELQLSKLQRQKQQDDHEQCPEEEEVGATMTWFVALALCLGFAFGCKYLF